MNEIITPRMKLIAANTEWLNAAMQGNQFLADQFKIEVAENWTEFGRKALQYTLDKLEKQPEETGWWMYFPILLSENKLIGSCGFKGPPDEKGIVEIGYEIAKPFRNQGLATELANAFIQDAFANEKVQQVIAHTLAHNNASTKVLQKVGMKKVAELFEDRQVWRWSIFRKSN